MSTKEPLVWLEHITRRFDDGTVALDRITLQVHRGECLILNGASGSGKSTLLGIIAGLERPTSGKIRVDGLEIGRLAEGRLNRYRRQKVGMVFQHFGLIEHLSVRENVEAALVPLRLQRKTLHKRTQEILHLAHIEHKADALIPHLSGGEKQRCAIARALVNTPLLLLCDEPTANLDHHNTKLFIETLQRLHTQGHTLIIATHDPQFDTLPFVSRKINIDKGQICTEQKE